MTMNETQYTQAWITLILAVFGTYFCRSIGVVLSGRVNQDSEFFIWLTSVTYALVAAMAARMIILPVGLLATVPLFVRLLICLVSILIMVSGTKRKLGPALLGGILCLLFYASVFN